MKRRLYILSHIGNRRRCTTNRHARLQIVDTICDGSDKNEEDENDEEDDNVALHIGGCVDLNLLGLMFINLFYFDLVGVVGDGFEIEAV